MAKQCQNDLRINELLGLYCQRWALSDPEEVHSSKESVVYRVSSETGHAILKLFSSHIDSAEAIALGLFQKSGTVGLLNAGPRALLLEYLAGEPLSALYEKGIDKKACEIIANVFLKLHSRVRPRPPEIASLRENFSSLFLLASKVPESPILREASGMAERLLFSQREETLLHGDLHHENILERREGDWVAIDPKPVFGERTYDLANVFSNPLLYREQITTPETISLRLSVLSEQGQVCPRRLLEYAFVRACQGIAWSREDGCPSEHHDLVANRLYRFLNRN